MNHESIINNTDIIITRIGKSPSRKIALISVLKEGKKSLKTINSDSLTYDKTVNQAIKKNCLIGIYDKRAKANWIQKDLEWEFGTND